MSSRRQTARRTSAPQAEGLYIWIAGCLVLATTILSLFDTYLLLTLMAE